MTAGDTLYARYHAGKRLLPQIFTSFYRTYDAKKIRGVTQGTLYPKYGFMQKAKQALKKAITAPFKSRAQREKERQPQYPSDLQGMSDMMDKVVTRLGQQTQNQPINTPEMQAARNAYQQYRMDRAKSLLQPDETDEIPQTPPNPPVPPAAPVQPDVPPVQSQTLQEPTDMTPDEMRASIERERQEHQQELLDPDNEINLDETISYYSPNKRQFIMESVVIGSDVLKQKLLRLRPLMAIAAQNLYDDWNPDDDFSGLCDEMASTIMGILSENGIESTEGGHEGDDHSFAIAYDDNSAFIVDVDPDMYEIGSGYLWEKIPGVTFEPNDVTVSNTYRPDWI